MLKFIDGDGIVVPSLQSTFINIINPKLAALTKHFTMTTTLMITVTITIMCDRL